jgi:hypothetical protein
MGVLVYEGRTTFRLEDRALLHLQLVMLEKLRRGETFALDLHDGRHMVTVWLNQRAALEFEYDGTPHLPLNQAWLQELDDNAGVHGVLRLTPEPVSATR